MPKTLSSMTSPSTFRTGPGTQTSRISASRDTCQRRAATSTPMLVESMNVTSVRSTTTRGPSHRTGSKRTVRRRAEVNTSSSPPTSTTVCPESLRTSIRIMVSSEGGAVVTALLTRPGTASKPRDLDGDVELTRVTGVLGEHVEADPLQRRRVLGEPSARRRCGVERDVAQDRAGPRPDRRQPGGDLLRAHVRGDDPSALDVRAPGLVDV